MPDMNGRKRNSGCSVSPQRFGKDFLASSRWQLLSKRSGLLGVGHRPNTVRWDQSTQAFHGLLQHSAFPDYFEQLLGSACAAAWPKTRATPSSENDGMRTEFFISHGIHTIKTREMASPSNPWRCNCRNSESLSGTITRKSEVASLGCSSVIGKVAGRNQA